MKNLQDWAEYYYHKGIFSYPSNNHFDFRNWNNKEKAEATFASRNWKGNYLSGVLGQKGKRAIKINIQGLDDYAIKVLLELILKKLFDSIIYPWVIKEINWIYIIVESKDITNCNNYTFSGVILLWQGHFPLPTSVSTINFYFKGIPTTSPQHISNEKLFESIDLIKDYLLSIREKKKANVKYNPLTVELSYLCSNKHITEVNAKRLGLSVEEYEKYKKEEEKLLKSFKKKLKTKNKIANLKQRIKHIANIVIVVASLLCLLILILDMIISPDSFKNIFKPIIYIAAVIMLCYFFIMFITPLYLIISSFIQVTNLSKIIRIILTIIGTIVTAFAFLILIYFIGRLIGLNLVTPII